MNIISTKVFEVFVMKKLMSVIISVIAAVSVCAAFAVPASAAINVYSPAGVAIVHSANDPLVNGAPSTQISGAQQDAGSNVLVFTYSGSGTLSGWNLIDSEGNAVSLSAVSAACRVVSQDGNTLIIEVLDWDAFESPDGYTVNALVEGESTTASTGETTTVNKDDSSTSPSTGVVSIAFAAIGAAGAGAAILALSKKKDAE